MNYTQIKNEQPILKNCFFAFSNEQFDEGIKKHNLEGQKIYRGVGGLYGTYEGIEELMNFYNGLSERISKECSPQEVYDYEFDNHECEYVGDDREAIEICLNYFSADECRTIKRRYIWSEF